MTKHRKPTEAEQIFSAFCDGYRRSMSLITLNSTEELHKAAKSYVKSVLKLKKEQEEQDND